MGVSTFTRVSRPDIGVPLICVQALQQEFSVGKKVSRCDAGSSGH
jgi:hypothetical protein